MAIPNKMKKFLLILITCISSAAIAQKTTRISGTVIDSLTQEPVEFAVVTLLNPGSNKPINGSVCDEHGKFSIDKVEKGNFQLAISFVGYTTRKITISTLEKGGETNLR